MASDPSASLEPGDRRTRRAAAAGLAVYVALMIVGVASPQTLPDEFDAAHQTLFDVGWLADAIRNVVLFVPFGLGLRLMGVGLVRAALIGLVFSISIEAVQTLIPGRFSSPMDLITNTIGTGVGVGLPGAAAWLLRETRQRPGRLAVISSAMACSVFAASSWLAQPAIPEVVFYGGWTPDYGGWDRYHGEVTRADIGRVPIPAWGPIERSAEVRDALLEHAPLVVDLRVGPAPDGLAPIVSLVDDHGHEYLLLGAQRDDVLFYVRGRAMNLGLHAPLGVLEGGLAGLPVGAVASLRLDRTATRTTLAIEGGPSARIDLPLARGWAYLLWPRLMPVAVHALFDAIWLAAWLAPAAFWCARRPQALPALIASLAWMVWLPTLGPLSPLTAVQWGVVALTVASAAGVSRWSLTRDTRG